MPSTQTLFSNDCYRIAPGVQLHRLQNAAAGHLSEIIVAMEPWRTLGFSQQLLQNYLSSFDNALKRYVLSSPEGPLGIVCVRYPWLRGPYLELLAVFPAAQRCGMGREVMRWLERESRGVSKNIWAVTSEFNATARKFYNKEGFVEIGTIPDLVTDGYNEILLRKRIHFT